MGPWSYMELWSCIPTLNQVYAGVHDMRVLFILRATLLVLVHTRKYRSIS